MSDYPIPDDALDDRLAFTGTSGSGKTFAAKGCVERLLNKRHRVVVIDPLDVWFGLRLLANGRDAAFPVAILGGRHGDLPLNEHAGALIGETVAKSSESCIVSLNGIKTSSGRQRFMLAFLDALYERTDPDARDPYHVVFDEADLWAPQKPMGNEAMLCHLMEEIVRRGRVKGFIPWLTASQDRDAIGSWIEGQADKAQGKDMLAELPRLSRGQAFVWIPGRGILRRAAFPSNSTFDSSRTPKRGERKQETALVPMDLPSLRDRLSTVEAEIKANDPRALKKRIADLERLLAVHAAPADRISPDPEAEARGYKRGILTADGQFRAWLAKTSTKMKDFNQMALDAFNDVAGDLQESGSPRTPVSPDHPGKRAIHQPPPPLARPTAEASGSGTISDSKQRVLDAIAWWRKIGKEPIERARACVVAGFSPTASTFGVYIAELAKLGLVVSTAGKVQLTEAGLALALTPKGASSRDLFHQACGMLSPQEATAFTVVYKAWPKPIRREDVAKAMDLSTTASTCGVYLAGVAKYGIIETAGRGEVKAADWLFP